MNCCSIRSFSILRSSYKNLRTDRYNVILSPNFFQRKDGKYNHNNHYSEPSLYRHLKNDMIPYNNNLIGMKPLLKR